MRFRPYQILGVQLGVWAWLCLARSVLNVEGFSLGERYIAKDGNYGNTDSALAARNATQLIIRETSYSDDSPDGIDCVSLCSAVSNPIKRGLEQIEPRYILEKRVFTEWPPPDPTNQGRNNFMVNAFKALRPDQEIVPDWAETGDGYASAVTAPLGQTSFRYGMQRICGCTLLFVVSRKRVYLAHYWEDVSFAQTKDEEGNKREVLFDEQVTDFLTSGFKAPKGPAQDSLQQHANDFRGADGLVAYIVTPDRNSKTHTGYPMYPAKVRKMASTVATILGISDEEVNKVIYDPVDSKKDKSNSLWKTAAGRMIFDFDPKGGSTAKPHAWRILWQNSQLDADQWS